MGVRRRFRGDIQGLRAIAVLTVVAAHAGVPFLPGGFVGVDVFFVISGYLIAGLLYREVSARSTFSLTRFWSRRARRIVPAATVTLVITVALSSLWMSLVDARSVAQDGLWAALFAANFRFAASDTDYFSQDSATSPLQHFWSLAVEEQFYVVWPLLLLLTLAVVAAVRRRAARRGGDDAATGLPRAAIAVVLGTVVVASFAWSVVDSSANPTVAYFSPFTRAWELALGALVALAPLATTQRMGRRTATVLATGGLAAIVVACLTFTPDVVFPGYAAALPVLGAVALLVAGSAGEEALTHRVVDNVGMRMVGDWSYSLYLWHWPALILPQQALQRSLTPLETVIALLVAVNLAALTFRFVETPFREGRPALALPSPRTLVVYPASVALVAVVSAGVFQWTGYQLGERGDNPAIAAAPGSDEIKDLVRASVDAAENDVAIPSNLTPDLVRLRDSVADVGKCDYSKAQEGVDVLCPRGDPDGSRTVVLIGDSHARAWIPALDTITEENGWRAFYLVKSQCNAAHVTVAALDQDEPFTACSDFHDWVEQTVDELEPDLVVVASSPPVNGLFTEEGTQVKAPQAMAAPLAEGYDDLFADLSASAGRVALMRDVPRAEEDPGTCLSQRDPSLSRCMFTPDATARLLGDVAVTAAEGRSVQVVDPTPWLCYDDSCPVVIGGTLSYRDNNHLTTEYAASLATPMGRALRMLRR